MDPSLSILPLKSGTRNRVHVQRFCAILKLSLYGGHAVCHGLPYHLEPHDQVLQGKKEHECMGLCATKWGIGRKGKRGRESTSLVP